MIRIDLFAGNDSSERRPISARTAAIGAVSLLVVAIVVGGGYLAVQALGGRDSTAVAKKSNEASEATGSSPSATSHIVRTPTTIPQRIASEMQFARRAMDMLADAVPREIRPLKLIKLDDFSVVRLQGNAQSQQAVRAVFNAVRKRGVTLQPPPNTVISSTGGGYAFTLAGKATFPLDTRDPFVDSAVARLPSPDGHKAEVARFERFAKDANVRIRKGLRYASTQKAGSYRRFAYRMDATAAFDDFVQFVRDLYAGRVSCSIGEATLKSNGSSPMTISATIYFTAKE
ncbi:MAG: hypothetical protein GF331_19610 [Chitinivibrionales bacterium]|nr:hypothetical protein [Chitinivibrionales bacterium]